MIEWKKSRTPRNNPMPVRTEKQRTIDLLLPAVQGNGPTDGENMPFVESFLKGRAAMFGGAERNLLSETKGSGISV